MHGVRLRGPSVAPPCANAILSFDDPRQVGQTVAQTSTPIAQPRR
jgi:hypothetical protein